MWDTDHVREQQCRQHVHHHEEVMLVHAIAVRVSVPRRGVVQLVVRFVGVLVHYGQMAQPVVQVKAHITARETRTQFSQARQQHLCRQGYNHTRRHVDLHAAQAPKNHNVIQLRVGCAKSDVLDKCRHFETFRPQQIHNQVDRLVKQQEAQQEPPVDGKT
eukprot:CAMPEP_0198551740 /NCGR_PEP_ID=MMETSP1462-20131121/77331_1 /TAXON_ID=1333877 /ORGANISM="Brandtodinium nutriculum, Strain RCC3387" /LENGTH=159 /DNA_ID=CAMNT_0044282389 /DNA_START=297 /DNA_END=772 /DNA_ORIENTATION=+